MNKTTFSVIIPTYNRAEFLKRSLNSLVSQTYKNFEVIVCDDGSTDNTKEIVRSFSEKLHIKYNWQVNWGGPARPRNSGIKIASSKWICFLDSDDWWRPDKLEIVNQYTSNGDLIFHDLDAYSSKGKLNWKSKGRYLLTPVFIDLMTNGTAIPNSSVVVKRKLLLKTGGLCEEKELIAVEDQDLWLKLARSTEKFVYIPKSLGVYWTMGDNISEFSEQQVERVNAVYNRHLAYLSDNNQNLANLMKYYTIARIKFQMGLIDEAFGLFLKTLMIHRYEYRFKSTYFIIWILLKKGLSKLQKLFS